MNTSDEICSLKLLFKVHDNLSFKIIDKSDLSIFYPYDFDKLNANQNTLFKFEATQVIYSIVPIITGEITYPENTFINRMNFKNNDLKELILTFKVIVDLVYEKNTINLVNGTGNSEFNKRSQKKILDLLEHHIKKIKMGVSFYDVRLVLRFLYPEEYSTLNVLDFKDEQDFEQILSFTVADYHLFKNDDYKVPLPYFKLLAKFIEHIDKLYLKLTLENKKDT